MPILLIDKIKPKNDGNFALVDAVDVEMPNGTRLSDWASAENEDSKLVLKKTAVELPLVPGSNVAATYGNGKFVAVVGQSVVYSTDSISWNVTDFSIPDVTVKSITYGNGKFVAVWYGGGAYSTDGVTWQTATMPVGNWTSVVYGNGTFVAVPMMGSTAVYSTDGVTWTTTPLSTDSNAYSDEYEAVVYGDGKFVAGDRYSTDGITWEACSGYKSFQEDIMAYGNGVFIALAYDILISQRIIYSDITDGVNWSLVTGAMPSASPWTSVIYGNDKFVAVAADSSIAYSTDGRTWEAAVSPIQAEWRSVIYGNGTFVAIASGTSTIIQSTDGINWTYWTCRLDPALVQDGENVTDVIRSLMPYPIVNASETDILMVDETYYLLEPDTYYVFGEVDSLPIYCAEPNDGRLHEFVFEFTPAEGFAGITFGSTEPKWANDLQFTPGKLCQVSIMRGIGVMVSA